MKWFWYLDSGLGFGLRTSLSTRSVHECSLFYSLYLSIPPGTARASRGGAQRGHWRRAECPPAAVWHDQVPAGHLHAQPPHVRHPHPPLLHLCNPWCHLHDRLCWPQRKAQLLWQLQSNKHSGTRLVTSGLKFFQLPFFKMWYLGKQAASMHLSTSTNHTSLNRPSFVWYYLPSHLVWAVQCFCYHGKSGCRVLVLFSVIICASVHSAYKFPLSSLKYEIIYMLIWKQTFRCSKQKWPRKSDGCHWSRTQRFVCSFLQG